MVLGVAAVVCVSSAVAGELLQDFKVGYILGGTPRTIQMVELIAVVVASLVMYFPLYILQVANHQRRRHRVWRSQALAAPQAGLMATLAQGIVGGEMAWPLVVAGRDVRRRDDHVQGAQPHAGGGGNVSAVPTTFAIFSAASLRWVTDSCATAPGTTKRRTRARRERRHPDRQRIDRRRGADGPVIAMFRFFEWPMPQILHESLLSRSDLPSCYAGSAAGAPSAR